MQLNKEFNDVPLSRIKVDTITYLHKTEEIESINNPLLQKLQEDLKRYQQILNSLENRGRNRLSRERSKEIKYYKRLVFQTGQTIDKIKQKTNF